MRLEQLARMPPLNWYCKTVPPMLMGGRAQTQQQVLTERAVASTPTFKAKVSFYGFILSDEGLIEVAWKYMLDYRCLLWKAYSILSDAKISFP